MSIERTGAVSGYKSHKEINFESKQTLSALLADFRLENEVYLELLHRHSQVYVGKNDQLEVDFVTINTDGLAYYQVAATVRDSATLERELASLRNIDDHYPKYLLTLDDDPDSDYDGIIRTNALRWMVNEE